jgi:hypothetical protein
VSGLWALCIGGTGNRNSACAGNALSSATLGIRRAFLIFENTGRRTTVAGGSVAIVAAFSRFNETVTTERGAKHRALGQTGRRTAVAVTAIAIVAEFPGIDPTVSAGGASTVGGRVAGMRTGTCCKVASVMIAGPM